MKIFKRTKVENKSFKLSEVVDKEYVIRDGIFQNLGSAKTTAKSHVICYAMNFEYLNIANNNPNISAIITLPELESKTLKPTVATLEPDIVFGKILNDFILNEYVKPTMEYKVSDSAVINETAVISPKVYIGNNVIIGRNVIINDYTIIEDNCIIGDNVVLGCDGFYFKRDKSGKLVKFLHAGGVHLYPDVEILTNSIIQRAHDADFTVIGEGTKISVNVNIGHSAKIGRHNSITGNVQIAGRVVVGDCCWIGTSSTISDSIHIGNNVNIRIGSIVVKNIKDGEDVSGNFAYNHKTRIKNFIKDQK